MHYEKYKDLFKEYYVKDQVKRLEYRKVYRKQISEGKPKNLSEDPEQLM